MRPPASRRKNALAGAGLAHRAVGFNEAACKQAEEHAGPRPSSPRTLRFNEAACKQAEEHAERFEAQMIDFRLQ